MYRQEQRALSLSGMVLRDTAEAVAIEMERAMQGHITKFHEAIGCGVIRAADGRKYRFSKSDIRNPDGRLVGLDVDFLVESRSPKDIILLHGSPWSVFAQRGPVGKRS